MMNEDGPLGCGTVLSSSGLVPTGIRAWSGLRLDTRDGAFSERSGTALIVSGKPQESLLYQRITHQQDALRMPPLASHRKLTDQQKDVVRRWHCIAPVLASQLHEPRNLLR